eukprot:325321_1
MVVRLHYIMLKEKGYNKISQQLINCINIQNVDGYTKLHMAVKEGNNKELQNLINANCDLNITDNDGETALHWAAEKGYDKISQQLINANCDVNIKDNNGWTALHYAAYDKTALHYAGYDKISQQIINANCDLNITDNDGETALHYAAVKGYYKIMQQLRNAKS